MKHAIAPWKEVRANVIADADGAIVARVNDRRPDACTNTRLILKAPELLKIAKWTLEELCGDILSKEQFDALLGLSQLIEEIEG